MFSVVEKVIIPFTSQILSKNLSIYISKYEKSCLIADWTKYKLILFNIIQNSIKYNIFNGKIIINLKVLGCQEDKNRMLETQIIDSGIGIREDEDKQNMLFKPFKELHNKENIL